MGNSRYVNIYFIDTVRNLKLEVARIKRSCEHMWQGIERLRKEHDESCMDAAIIEQEMESISNEDTAKDD